MTYAVNYRQNAVSIEKLSALTGWTLLEFGTDWCGHCRLAQVPLKTALQDYPNVQHIKEEDGKGRKLGRFFGVKFWPTLILLKDGDEVARDVRPRDDAPIRKLLSVVDA